MALLLTSCATLTPESCREKNAFAMGRDEVGDSYSEYKAYRKSCAELGVKLDDAEYERGRAEGLRRFCSSNNGYRLGEEGREYHGSCPKEQKEAFLAAYRQGLLMRKQKELEARMHDLETKKRCTTSADCPGVCGSDGTCQ